MANKQNFKDRKRDQNPSNRPPKAQVEEQKIKGKTPADKPATQRARRPKKDAPSRKVVADFAPDAPEVFDAKRDVRNPLLRVTDTTSGTIHDEAGRLAIRKGKETSPVEVVEVEGNKVEVVARPEVLHPVELMPHQRDTVIKDRLRESDDPVETDIADARVATSPPDWHPHAVEMEQASPQGKTVADASKQAVK